MMDDNGLTQLVTQPSLPNNTLYLSLCNNPSLFRNVKVLPDLADRDVVLVEGNISPIVNKHTRRKIYLLKRADWDGLRAHMEGSYSAHAEQETMDCEASVDVESRWKSFVQLLNSGIEKFIPSKIAKQKNHLPVTLSQRN